MTDNTSDATEFTPIMSQQEFDTAIGERLAEIESGHATKLAEARSRADAAESRITELEAAAVRHDIATTAGVPAELLHGTTREELEQSASALVAFRAASRVEPDPNQGRTSHSGPGGKFDLRSLFAQR